MNRKVIVTAIVIIIIIIIIFLALMVVIPAISGMTGKENGGIFGLPSGLFSGGAFGFPTFDYPSWEELLPPNPWIAGTEFLGQTTTGILDTLYSPIGTTAHWIQETGGNISGGIQHTAHQVQQPFISLGEDLESGIKGGLDEIGKFFGGLF